MGLIQCPDCGSMISEHAPACPSCGCPAEYFNPNFQEIDDYQDSGSGDGILSGILKTAVGVALGNRQRQEELYGQSQLRKSQDRQKDQLLGMRPFGPLHHVQ